MKVYLNVWKWEVHIGTFGCEGGGSIKGGLNLSTHFGYLGSLKVSAFGGGFRCGGR